MGHHVLNQFILTYSSTEGIALRPIIFRAQTFCVCQPVECYKSAVRYLYSKSVYEISVTAKTNKCDSSIWTNGLNVIIPVCFVIVVFCLICKSFCEYKLKVACQITIFNAFKPSIQRHKTSCIWKLTRHNSHQANAYVTQ